MIKTFTPNDALRFAYGELKGTEHEEFIHALPESEDLMRHFRHYKSMKKQIDAALSEPSDQSLNKIRLYTKLTQKN